VIKALKSHARILSLTQMLNYSVVKVNFMALAEEINKDFLYKQEK